MRLSKRENKRLCVHACVRERETDRQTDQQTDRECNRENVLVGLSECGNERDRVSGEYLLLTCTRRAERRVQAFTSHPIVVTVRQDHKASRWQGRGTVRNCEQKGRGHSSWTRLLFKRTVTSTGGGRKAKQWYSGECGWKIVKSLPPLRIAPLVISA